jgi:hypothetical protein
MFLFIGRNLASSFDFCKRKKFSFPVAPKISEKGRTLEPDGVAMQIWVPRARDWQTWFFRRAGLSYRHVFSDD